MTRGTAGPLQILLVEDSPADIRLTREALREASVPNDLHVVENGEEAMDFVRRDGPYAESPTPDLMLLDLNLPRKDGRAVLRELKSDPDLRAIPVLVLTTSSAEQDIRESYAAHANAYVTKPTDLVELRGVVRAIESFWLTTARLPTSA